jgi:hypothetical protein
MNETSDLFENAKVGDIVCRQQDGDLLAGQTQIRAVSPHWITLMAEPRHWIFWRADGRCIQEYPYRAFPSVDAMAAKMTAQQIRVLVQFAHRLLEESK